MGMKLSILLDEYERKPVKKSSPIRLIIEVVVSLVMFYLGHELAESVAKKNNTVEMNPEQKLDDDVMDAVFSEVL